MNRRGRPNIHYSPKERGRLETGIHIPGPTFKAQSDLIRTHPARDLPGVDRGLIGQHWLRAIGGQLHAAGSEGDLEIQGVPQDDVQGIPLTGSQ